MVNNLPIMQETWDLIPWRRKWQPIPVFLPGKSHGQRSLEGCSSQGHKKSGMTERLTHTNDLFTLFPHLPPSLIHKRICIQAPTIWLYWGARLPSSQWAGFPLFLTSALCPLDLLAYLEVSRVILDLVTIWLELKMVTLIAGGLVGLTGWGKALVWVLMKSEGF